MMEIISSLTEDLEKIKQDAQSVHSCLTEHPLTTGKHSVLFLFHPCFSLSFFIGCVNLYLFVTSDLRLCRSPAIREAAVTRTASGSQRGILGFF